MRVISGKLKGRNVLGYDILGTRPTMDRVKESIFSIIQNYVKGSIVLDLFSGSGNLGIEALSNGASKCYFIDNNKVAINMIKKNINNFELENSSVIIKDDYNNALNYFKINNIKFDIIFLDPPYKNIIIDNIISYIIKNNLLNNNGLIIAEYENSIVNKNYENLMIYKDKKYGSKLVTIFKKEDK